MLAQFVSVLLQVLLAKSHALLSEEIGIVLYNMASVDFNAFFTSFLPHFLSSCDGLDENQKATLALNFSTESVSIMLYITISVKKKIDEIFFFK